MIALLLALALAAQTPQAPPASTPTTTPQTPPAVKPDDKSKPKKPKKPPKPPKKPVVQPPKKEQAVTKPETPQLPPKVEPANAVEQKLDGPLLAILRSFKAGGMAQAQATASAEKLTDPKNRIKIDITMVDAAKFKEIEKKIQEANGEIVTNLDNRVFAWLPLDAIETLAASADVWSLATVRETVRQQ